MRHRYLRLTVWILSSLIMVSLILSLVSTAQAATKLQSWSFNEPLYGINFSPFEKDPNNLNHVAELSYSQQVLTRLKGKVRWLRFFGLDRNQSEVVVRAKRMRFKIAAGAWVSSDQESTKKQIDELKKLMKAKKVDLAVVGNEVLDTDNGVSESELISYIKEVKTAAKGRINVTTAAGPAVWQSKPNLVKAVDVIGLNVYPFWAKASIESALKDFQASYSSVKRLAGNRQVIVTETGWPSDGGSNGSAVGSLLNAQRYFDEVSIFAIEHNIPLFWFSAADEPWKTQYEQQFGAHWGLYDRNGKQKLTLYSMLKKGAKGDAVLRLQTRLAELGYFSKAINGSFDSHTAKALEAFQREIGIKKPTAVASTLLQLKLFAKDAKRATAADSTPMEIPMSPGISEVSFPAYGKSGYLTGRVKGATSPVYLVVFLQVDGRWWVKPYWDSFITLPDKNGYFRVDVDTGGIDVNANAYEIYLLLGSTKHLPLQLLCCNGRC